MNSAQKNKALGSRGESIAAEYLKGKGLKLIGQNYHAQGGEIDLIMKDAGDDSFVLVEVKTRKSDLYGGGAEAITRSKFNKILSAAAAYFIKELRLPEMPDFRVDAVILKFSGEKVFCEHIENIGFDDF